MYSICTICEFRSWCVTCNWEVSPLCAHTLNPFHTPTHTRQYTRKQWGSASCYESYRAEVISVCTLSSYITPSKQCTNWGEKVHRALFLSSSQSFISASFLPSPSLIHYSFFTSFLIVFFFLSRTCYFFAFFTCSLREQYLKISTI